jgi:hypothetical protein
LPVKSRSGCGCRYEKLQHWELALDAYKRKAIQAQSNPDELKAATLGWWFSSCALLNVWGVMYAKSTFDTFHSIS